MLWFISEIVIIGSDIYHVLYYIKINHLDVLWYKNIFNFHNREVLGTVIAFNLLFNIPV